MHGADLTIARRDYRLSGVGRFAADSLGRRPDCRNASRKTNSICALRLRRGSPVSAGAGEVFVPQCLVLLRWIFINYEVAHMRLGNQHLVFCNFAKRTSVI